ncbi:hypothetical protein FisN_7Lh014 [Fistulifera solaris]|uniref:Sec-independent protein translocase protein TatB n=1 Tax=Fistulifera solaris TaxID=1519565 RepID=A0A1Z5JCC8_FISSO|nr:hypothetical protein FisN_7Lh014 [Fistulifera solaris]|eukprot:GAX11654.1 hypothetical protein FisN_7Lh014 [Fistulifera solaris]
MFDISWGEMGILIGVTTFFIGKQDLPKAARYAGTYVGRFVGFIQGARARADRFAANHELKQLQNELRSGLRELDVVKSELATSLSSRGMMGRTLGSTVKGVNRTDLITNTQSNVHPQTPLSLPSVTSPAISTTQFNPTTTPLVSPTIPLPPQRQTMGAVAEEEWKRQGIDFISRAERGTNSRMNVEKSGSATLAFLLKESLLFSQYDRMVQEQEQALQKRMTATEEQFQAHRDLTKEEKRE